LLGLAMTCQAADKSPEADFFFNLLTENRVPDSIRSSHGVWRFHSFIFPGQNQQALDYALLREAESDSISDVPLWSSVAIAGISQGNSGIAQSLIRCGFCGLAKANEFQLMDEIHQRHPGVQINGQDFFALWMSGYSALKNASMDSESVSGKTRQSQLQFARSRLQSALDLTNTVAPLYRARCRYHLGFAHYSSRNFDIASSEFQRASALLGSLDPELAEHAAWMQCQALHRLASQDLAWQKPMMFALSEFGRRYPNSPNAGQAAFMQVMNQLEDTAVEQAIESLKSIPPEDENYLQAQFEICRLSHQAWASSTDPGKRELWATQLIDVARKFVQKSNPQTATSHMARYARVCLLVADAMVQQSGLMEAGTWLNRYQEVMPALASETELQSDYFYLRMRFAAQRNETVAELEASEWLLRNASRSTHIRAALISQARALDQELQLAIEREGVPDSRQLTRVIDTYQRLLENFSFQTGEANQEYWGDNPSARAALLRLAELEIMAGNVAESRKYFETLHQLAPRELAYLLGLARAETTLSHFEVAAQHWRTIAAGLAAGHDAWLESKFNLAVCLLNGEPKDPTRAAAVLQQTRLLVPELPEAWASRFDELEKQVSN